MKSWLVSDAVTGETEDFETEAEALAYAEEILGEHRAEASCNGEWPDETEFLRVYKLSHRAQIVESGTTELGEWVEYGIRQAP